MTSPFARPPDLSKRRRSGVAWLIAVFVTLLSSAVRAEDAVELDWSAPPSCPDAAEVHERIRSLAGETLGTKERLRATGRIERRGARFRLTLILRDGDTVGERTVDSDSCADLAGAAAVALGLLLEDKRQAEQATTRSNNGGATALPGAKDTPASRAAPQRRAATPPSGATKGTDSPANSDAGGERPFHVLALLPFPTLDLGPLPEPSFGVGAGAGAKFHGIRLMAVGRYYSTATVAALDYPAAAADIDRLSAELWACHGFRADRFELSPCLTGSLDHYTARGRGIDVTPRSARSVVVALGGGLSADVHLVDWLALGVTAALRAETARPLITIEDFGEVRKLGFGQASFAVGTTWIL